MTATENLMAELTSSLLNERFVKMSLGNYHGKEEALAKIYIKKSTIRNTPKLSFTYRYKTNDIVKNYGLEEAGALIETLLGKNGFRLITLFTLDSDLSLSISTDDIFTLKKNKASNSALLPLDHDKQKNRKIETTGKRYLQELKITDKEGNVYKSSQDKFRQINHYVEILSSLLRELPKKPLTNVVDMGAGKGYLTFALYDYLTNVLHTASNITGVEYRKELVGLCNDIARKSNFEKLSFVQGTIEDYQNPDIDVLIALHACDTATDDAIAKGIRNNADLIVVAPCCHKQIRREIEKNKVQNDLGFLLKHGIFLERQAEMVTDGIRALVLEYFGYATKVFEFISDAHTPKNVLIVGQKKYKHSAAEKMEILNKIKAGKAYFGIGFHHLEKIMGLME